MLTSHLLVKVGSLENKFNKPFLGVHDIFFKALEVSYNFPRNSLLQKMHEFFIIPKIPFRRSKLQNMKFFQNDPKMTLSHFSFQTPSKQSWNHQNFRIWLSCLEFIKDSKNVIFHFYVKWLFFSWCRFCLFCTIFLHYPYLRPKSWNTTLLTQLTHKDNKRLNIKE